MAMNRKIDREKKIKFLQEQFPDIKKIDFYKSPSLLWMAKDLLFKSGLYASKQKSSILDTAILKLCADAQGVKPFKQVSTTRTRGPR
jgi:hypothetical protein